MASEQEPHSETKSRERQFWSWKESPLLLQLPFHRVPPGVESRGKSGAECPRVVNLQRTRTHATSGGRRQVPEAAVLGSGLTMSQK